MADDLSTYWQDLPSRETPLDATTLNAWGALVEEQASAATLAATEATAAATTAEEAAEAATAPTDTQVAALLTNTGSQTRAALGSGITASAAAVAPVLRLRSTAATGQYTLALDDVASHGHDVLNISHAGDGTTGPTTQAYAINIANQAGARPALVIHQYSYNGSAVRIDNTDIAASLQIWNTENTTKNPGRTGTGPFLQLHPYGEADELYLTNDLTWLNNTTKNLRVQSTAATAYTFGLDSAQDIPSLYITKRGTGAGSGVYVANSGTGPAVDLYQNGTTGLGLRITAGAGHSTYAFQIKGQTYGGSFETEINSSAGQVLTLNKKGTGAGEGMRIINAGTGASISLRNASAEVARFLASGELEHLTAGAGILLRSPDGTRYRVSIANGGAISVVSA